MRPLLNNLSLGLALSLTLAMSNATASEDVMQGDAQEGKAKSTTCLACHSADGNSVVPTFPKLAGQHAEYTVKQLNDFKAGDRVDGTMQGMVAALSEQDMLNLGKFYSEQTPNVGEVSAEMADAAKAGEEIYRAGLAKFSVTACMACHGPDGKGVAPSFPRLSGQHAPYIEKQLLAFKDGSRTDSMMSSIAFPLSAEQIKNLAIYISGLY